MTAMATSRYLIVFFLALLLLAGLVAGINYAVDPYAVSGAKRIDGFNAYKVDVNSRVRLAKTYQPQRLEFQTLIVGNSRVEMGIDPQHECLAFNGRRAYNLGIPGASIAYQTAAALDLVYQKPVDTVLMSLDFPDFLVPAGQLKPGESQPLLPNTRFLPDGSENPDYPLSRVKDFYGAWFSLNGLISSVKTVLMQSELSADRREDGFNPAGDFVKSSRVEGMRALFLQKEQLLQQKYQRSWALHYSGGERSEDFDYLQQFLETLVARDIQVVLFINPLHERFWNLLEDNQLMPLYPQWQAMLQQVLQAVASDSIVLWDFSGDSPYIHEPLPEAHARGQSLQWFWEPAHYTKALGNVMLPVMFPANCQPAEHFGVQRYPAVKP